MMSGNAPLLRRGSSGFLPSCGFLTEGLSPDESAICFNFLCPHRQIRPSVGLDSDEIVFKVKNVVESGKYPDCQVGKVNGRATLLQFAVASQLYIQCSRPSPFFDLSSQNLRQKRSPFTLDEFGSLASTERTTSSGAG